jgi:FkbM family methyltransferase
MQHFLDIIKFYDRGGIKTVFDVGSRDGAESVTFAEKFTEASVYAFECNPKTIPYLRERASKYTRIAAIEKAVTNYDGVTKFYPTNMQTVTSWADGNPGASSLFKANGNYPAEKYMQDEIEVPCTRLDTFCKEKSIDKIDILWIDLQGAEMLAFESLGDLIHKVKFINTEVTFKEMYTGQCLFEDVNSFLTSKGFKLINDKHTFKMQAEGHWQSDGIYVNENLIGA